MRDPALRRPGMHVTLRQLQVFEAAARLGSITRTAEALHLSPSAVSTQLKQLAEAVGQPLFETAGRRLVPTGIGEELRRTAGEIFDAWQRFEATADDRRALRAGQVRVAGVTSTQAFLPDLVAAFRARHPGVDVQLAILGRDAVVERLARGEDDLSIMAMPPQHFDLALHPFLDNPLVPVAAAGHPLAGKRRVPLARFARECLLLRERGSGTRLAMERFFRERGIAWTSHRELAPGESLTHAVAAGQGVAVMPQHVWEASPVADRLVRLDVAEFPSAGAWYALHPGGQQLSAAAQAFLDFLVAEAPALAPLQPLVSASAAKRAR